MAAKRKAAAKRSARKAGTPTSTKGEKALSKAFKPKTAARTKVHSRKHAARPMCPICGSRDVELVKPANEAKAASRLAAGVVTPIIVDHHGGLACHSCGYREEAS